ncbi:MAG TPA: hypothetical protein VMR62_25705 [Bryobacteraceae bacterium]|jgi:hypothetical protein|nr:hypothetical protein [Bryobacteraceae bacterium]
MKQNITLAIDPYAQSKARALAQLDSPFHLGGQGVRNREAIHDRNSLR